MTTTTLTLTELLDRLAELRPDICSKLIPADKYGSRHSYHIYTKNSVLSFYGVDRWAKAATSNGV
jgi:hypothetical protein